MYLIKNRFNRYATAILRNYPWPVKRKILNQSPLFSGDATENIVVVLCHTKQYLEGFWSLWSWMRFLKEYAKPVLLIDGIYNKKCQNFFSRLFPNGELISISDLINENSINPQYLPFLRHSRFGMKLIAVNMLQYKYNVLYSDSDVLALNAPEDIIKIIKNTAGHPAYLYDEIGYPVDPWIKNRASEIGVKIDGHFNAGLVWLPSNAINQDLFISLLEGWLPENETYQTEQTLFSALVSSANGVSLPSSTNVLSWHGVWCYEKDLPCSEIHTRHYVGPVRHRMYLSAYPWMISQVNKNNL
jgi:hypothetical protein